MSRRRVVVYVTRGDELLVFEHRDYPEAGTQVPAGGVRPGERVEEAVLREVLEETGLVLTGAPRFLGDVEHTDGLGRPARSSFFQIDAPPDVIDSWQHTVTGDGEDQALVFLCRFDAAPRLHETQDRYLLERHP